MPYSTNPKSSTSLHFLSNWYNFSSHFVCVTVVFIHSPSSVNSKQTKWFRASHTQFQPINNKGSLLLQGHRKEVYTRLAVQLKYQQPLARIDDYTFNDIYPVMSSHTNTQTQGELAWLGQWQAGNTYRRGREWTHRWVHPWVASL